MSDLTSLDFMKKQVAKLSSNEQATEYWNCRRNPFYFIFNYVNIPEVGGILKYEESMMHSKIKRVIKSIYNYHRVILMASRQLGKALDLNTLIQTPTGLVKLKDLHINDFILDENFSPTKIVAETPIQYNRPCFKLKFSCDEEVIADENHLWKVTIPQLKIFDRIYSTKILYNFFNKEYQIFLDDSIELIKINKTKSVPVKCIQIENTSGMFLITKNNIPTHNSTIAGCMLEWAANFYPNLPITILNATKKAALGNLEIIKFIHMALPDFLRTPLKYKGDRKTTLDYTNESLIRIFYPSSTTSPNTLARSFTSPILYIDEAAHIRHMKIAYAAAQPTLSRAREQAIKHNYPYYILISSTPNGSAGDGEWFYNMYNNAINSDEMFDENSNLLENSDEIINNPTSNGFVGIRYHWSEDPTKNDDWYLEQCKDFNFDTRSINQELDLVFVGSTNCIFSDDFLSKLKITKPVDKIDLPHITDLKLYIKREKLDKNDFLLIGVDTAKSITGDFSAIEIFKYSNFEQVGEFFGKLGSLTKYSEIIMKLVDILEVVMNRRIILCIENNSIGSAIIEDLENAEDPKYAQYIYSPFPDKYTGINTNAKIKNTMVSFFYDLIINNPENLKSEALINQLNLIERHNNGSIRGTKDDLFMASVMCAYIRKISSLEYEPLLGISTHIQEQKTVSKLRSALRSSTITPKSNSGIQITYNREEGGIEYNISTIDYDDDSGESYVSIF